MNFESISYDIFLEWLVELGVLYSDGGSALVAD